MGNERVRIKFNDTGYLVFSRKGDGKVEMYTRETFDAYKQGLESGWPVDFVADKSLTFDVYIAEQTTDKPNKVNEAIGVMDPAMELDARDKKIKQAIESGLVDCW